MESGLTDISKLLNNETSSLATTSNVGTQNYSKPAKAVVVGAGYEVPEVEQLQAACRGDGKKTVPFLICDMSVPRPPLGPAYGKAIVERVKKRVLELNEEGKLGKADELLHY